MRLPLKDKDKNRDKAIPKIAIMLALMLLLSTQASTQNPQPQDPPPKKAGQIRIPTQATTPLFAGKQGKQKTEISFDPATRMVTLKFLVQDPNGYFITNIRRDNFVVYENDARQQNVTCEIEHAPASLLLLLEFGGRAPGFNREASQKVTEAAEEFMDELGREDRIAIWKYNDKVDKIADPSDSREKLSSILLGLGAPEVSETNLYDAIIFATEQMRPIAGRKAIILISSGIDTFSKAHYQDVLQTVQDADTPIYAVGLTRVLRDIAEREYRTGSVAKMDWTKAEMELQKIASASGGRAYVPENTVDLSPIYDDMMENLKVRYVLTYRSSNNLDPNTPRSVRVALVDPNTGGPLRIVDANAKTVPAMVVVQDSYTPNSRK
jgi:Ca-activated chloride channel homolog